MWNILVSFFKVGHPKRSLIQFQMNHISFQEFSDLIHKGESLLFNYISFFLKAKFRRCSRAAENEMGSLRRHRDHPKQCGRHAKLFPSSMSSTSNFQMVMKGFQDGSKFVASRRCWTKKFIDALVITYMTYVRVLQQVFTDVTYVTMCLPKL